MIITAYDVDGDGTNDIYVVQRPLTAAESAALVKAVFSIVVVLLVLWGLAWLGLALLDATNWVVNTLSRWTRWDWLFWLSLPFISVPTIFVFAKTLKLRATFVTLLATGFPFALLAALWSWNTTGWVIFAGIVLGVLTLAGGTYFIFRDRYRSLTSNDEPLTGKQPSGASLHVQCPSCQKKLKIPAQLMERMLKCPTCQARLRIRNRMKENHGQQISH